MSSKKGSEFERNMGPLLSLWWTDNERDDVFWRRDSGARAKRRSREGKHTFGAHGDICAIDPVGLPLTNLCTIELKNGYGKWSLLDVVDRPPMRKGQKNKTLQTFEAFLDQVIEDAEAVGTYPVIVSKRDKRQPVIIYPRAMHKRIYSYYKKSPKTEIMTIRGNEHMKNIKAMVVMNFNYFLTWCKPDFFKAKGTMRKE